MSRLFYERVMRDHILPMEDKPDLKDLDEEVERITNTECDAFARTASPEEFKRVAEEAVKRVKKKKQDKKKSQENPSPEKPREKKEIEVAA